MKFDKHLVQKEKRAFLMRIIKWSQKNKKMVEKLSKQDIQEACRSKPT